MIRFRALPAMCVTASLTAMLTLTSVAVAQVGHLPGSSPYEDVKLGQSVSVSGGWLAVKRDPADVAPKASAFLAVRYDIGIGGPASLYVRYSLAPSERRLLDPANPAATRLQSTPSIKTTIADVGFDISLTGQKTYHRVMPSLSAGLGVVSDFAAADTGAYRFGTKFAFTYGAGIRIIPSGSYAIRLTATNYVWQYQYPDRYFIAASDGTSILQDTRKRSAYRGNWGLSAGLLIPLFR